MPRDKIFTKTLIFTFGIIAFEFFGFFIGIEQWILFYSIPVAIIVFAWIINAGPSAPAISWTIICVTFFAIVDIYFHFLAIGGYILIMIAIFSFGWVVKRLASTYDDLKRTNLSMYSSLLITYLTKVLAVIVLALNFPLLIFSVDTVINGGYGLYLLPLPVLSHLFIPTAFQTLRKHGKFPTLRLTINMIGTCCSVCAMSFLWKWFEFFFI